MVDWDTFLRWALALLALALGLWGWWMGAGLNGWGNLSPSPFSHPVLAIELARSNAEIRPLLLNKDGTVNQARQDAVLRNTRMDYVFIALYIAFVGGLAAWAIHRSEASRSSVILGLAAILCIVLAGCFDVKEDVEISNWIRSLPDALDPGAIRQASLIKWTLFFSSLVLTSAFIARPPNWLNLAFCVLLAAAGLAGLVSLIWHEAWIEPSMKLVSLAFVLALILPSGAGSRLASG